MATISSSDSSSETNSNGSGMMLKMTKKCQGGGERKISGSSSPLEGSGGGDHDHDDSNDSNKGVRYAGEGFQVHRKQQQQLLDRRFSYETPFLLHHCKRLLANYLKNGPLRRQGQEDNNKSSAYLKAVELAPHLVETESDPAHFLRATNFDVSAAAERLLGYWELRRAVFGERRAFLPMMDLSCGGGGDSALSEQDVAELKQQPRGSSSSFPSLTLLLPDDADTDTDADITRRRCRRAVIFENMDVTVSDGSPSRRSRRRERLRFYLLSVASSLDPRDGGIDWIQFYNCVPPLLDLQQQEQLQQQLSNLNSLAQSMPVEIASLHVCFLSNDESESEFAAHISNSSNKERLANKCQQALLSSDHSLRATCANVPVHVHVHVAESTQELLESLQDQGVSSTTATRILPFFSSATVAATVREGGGGRGGSGLLLPQSLGDSSSNASWMERRAEWEQAERAQRQQRRKRSAQEELEKKLLLDKECARRKRRRKHRKERVMMEELGNKIGPLTELNLALASENKFLEACLQETQPLVAIRQQVTRFAESLFAQRAAHVLSQGLAHDNPRFANDIQPVLESLNDALLFQSLQDLYFQNPLSWSMSTTAGVPYPRVGSQQRAHGHYRTIHIPPHYETMLQHQQQDLFRPPLPPFPPPSAAAAAAMGRQHRPPPPPAAAAPAAGAVRMCG